MAAAKVKESKNQRRRALKKARKQEVSAIHIVHVRFQANCDKATETPSEASKPHDEVSDAGDKTIPSTPSFDVEISEEDPLFEQFKEVIEKFQERAQDDPNAEDVEKPEVYFDQDDEIPDEDDERARKLSRK